MNYLQMQAWLVRLGELCVRMTSKIFPLAINQLQLIKLPSVPSHSLRSGTHAAFCVSRQARQPTPERAWPLFRSRILDDYLAFQLAIVTPRIAKSMRPDNPNNKKEIL